jgi:hypothetical protein
MVTETVYQHEIRPALATGATAMDKILSKKLPASARPHTVEPAAKADLRPASGVVVH